MTQGPKVVVEDVSLVLGGTEILSRVSHVFDAGRLHCILGPNGGGKTSLIRSILGQTQFRGAIRLEGGDVGTVGYVPQSIEIDRSLPLTVMDVMTVMLQRRPAFFGPSRQTRRRIEAALEIVGMSGMAGRRFGALSGGERQRVLFAQAMVPDPALLLLDEPTSSLDEAGDRLIESRVVDLARAGTTVIWINHDWVQARRVADCVVGINRSVTMAGPPSLAMPGITEGVGV